MGVHDRPGRRAGSVHRQVQERLFIGRQTADVPSSGVEARQRFHLEFTEADPGRCQEQGAVGVECRQVPGAPEGQAAGDERRPKHDNAFGGVCGGTGHLWAPHPSSVTVAARTGRSGLPKFPDFSNRVTGSLSTVLHQGSAKAASDIQAAVTDSGTTLTDLCGVGALTAGKILGRVGTIDRFRSAAAFATYTGTAPIDVSSGDVVRLRLSRAGGRLDTERRRRQMCDVSNCVPNRGSELR